MVLPMRWAPFDSWMCPCRPTTGWYFLMTSRTALLPTGIMLGRPPRMTGSSVSSSSAAKSRPEPYGGLWKLAMTFAPFGAGSRIADRRCSSSSSRNSRSVFHGVGVTSPQLASRTGPISQSSRSGHSIRGAAFSTGSMASGSSLPGVMMQRTFESSRSSASLHQPSTCSAMAAVNAFVR